MFVDSVYAISIDARHDLVKLKKVGSLRGDLQE